MACLTNYAIQCKDVKSNKIGCFFYDQAHWQKTGEFMAIGHVYDSLYDFYKSTTHDQRKSCYLERDTNQ